ncbi:MAG: hypothetical protein ABSA44_04200 [Bacteroidota bacterium]|jgi:hypothetical protein
MNLEEYQNLLGMCWLNYNSLETTIRFYLMNYEKQSHHGLEINEGETCQEDYLTNYMTFRQLLDKYNGVVKNEFQIPNGKFIIKFRDSMAHGRTVTKDDFPMTVYIYSKPQKHVVKLEIKQELSKKYLESIATKLYHSIMIVDKALSKIK